MPFHVLTDAEKAHLNAKHVKTIRHDIERLWAESPLPDANNNGQEVQDDEPIHNDNYTNRMAKLLEIPDTCEKVVRSMSEIMSSADAQHRDVLKLPWYVTMKSNRNEVFLSWLYENVEEIFENIPARSSLFELLAWQRAAIAATIFPMPQETYVELSISRTKMEMLTAKGCRKTGFSAKYTIEENAMPVINIASSVTGSGKTIIQLMAMLVQLCCRKKWKELETGYRDQLRKRLREKNTGLCKGEALEEGKLARLVMISVPHNLVPHWESQAKAAINGAKEWFGHNTDVVLWRGRHSEYSIKNAYESKKATIWILPLEGKSAHPLLKSPEIGIVARIVDEPNRSQTTGVTSRYNQMESPVLSERFAQATIESLCGSTVGQPRHPLRLALGDNFVPLRGLHREFRYSNYKMVENIMNQGAKLFMFMPPDAVLRMISSEAERHMPKGIVVQRLRVRPGTLNAAVTGSDLVKVSFPELALSLLGQGVAVACKDAVRNIFAKEEPSSPAELLSELAAHLETMPSVSIAENNARSAVIRLNNHLTSIFNGQPLECPVSMAPVPKERVRILTCCTAVLDANSLKMCNERCPLCRAPLNGVALKDVEKDLAHIQKQQKEACQQATLSPSLKGKKRAIDEVDGVDSDDCDSPTKQNTFSESDLESAISEISARRPHVKEGLVEAINVQLKKNPSSRILVAFPYDRYQQAAVRDISNTLLKDVTPTPSVCDMERISCDYIEAGKVMKRYNSPKDNMPQILLLATSRNSASIQGMDLHATDLTIISGYASPDVQRQTLGRSLRMQRRPKNMKKEERFPYKRVLFLTMDAPRPPRAPEELPPEPPLEELSDSESE